MELVKLNFFVIFIKILAILLLIYYFKVVQEHKILFSMF